MSYPPPLATEAEIADLVSFSSLQVGCGDTAQALAVERDQLRELVKAKDEYIACYKLGKRPSEALFSKLKRLTTYLYPKDP